MTERIKENRLDFPESDSGPLELNSIQQLVFEILSATKSQKYSLGDWYLGAIHAAKNTYNPDRFSQAAQSLRELLEKFPRVYTESEVQGSTTGLADMRRELYSRLCADENRYGGQWKGKPIDPKLAKTIRKMGRYLELNQIPTRKERIHSVISKIDPMHNDLDQEIKLEKSQRFHSVWEFFEKLAHHNTHPDEEGFWQHLELTEHLIIDLLAPITAQDQAAIRKILEKQHPEKADVDNLLALIKRRGANYAYFFTTVINPIWIDPLHKNGFFKNPPSIEAAGDGRVTIPLWWPILYLRRVSDQKPEQVVAIIRSMEQTDNPRILREIFSIACDLKDTELSIRLKPLIKQFLKSPYRWGEEELIVKILKKWGSDQGPPRNAAYEIIKNVIAFEPDPKEDEKRFRRKDNPEAWNTSLEPIPRFDQWEYQQILREGVRPLAEHDPYQVARILLDATASMIRLRIHQDEVENGRDEDRSEIWCRWLGDIGDPHAKPEEVLVRTLVYACERVYEKAPHSVGAIDQALRNQRWKIFKRIRQYLYSLRPNKQTLPWIREFILGHEDYAKWDHHYEFQLMIRKACKHFGASLLSELEQKAIFDSILGGPSKESYREFLGDQYSEAGFQKRQRNFHRKQLHPFASLLSGEYRDYYDELGEEFSEKPLLDVDYMPFKISQGGFVQQKSPKTAEELKALSDREILRYINEWDDAHHEQDNRLIEITISALASAFQSLFKEVIIPDEERWLFWNKHCEEIKRPVYIASMVSAMKEIIKEKRFDKLEQGLEFCDWVLKHPDTEPKEGEPNLSDESCEHPDWGSSRRAVADFVETCVEKEVNAPVTARAGIADILEKICVQFDRRLDCGQPVILNEDDPITEAINNTRSRAIQSLVYFGLWIRRHLPEDSASEVSGTLELRLRDDAEFKLTKPEYAILGMHFTNLCDLDIEWASRNREKLFPLENFPFWQAALSSYLEFDQPATRVFNILRGDFKFALNHFKDFSKESGKGENPVDRLGQHLFAYYLWESYPLKGEESLLDLFFKKSDKKRQHWADLFDYIGRTLKKSDRNLDSGLIKRIKAFFEWRLETGEKLELQEFAFWLEAECLEPEWRLNALSRILDIGFTSDRGIYHNIKALESMLQDHLLPVVDCFAKLTDLIDKEKSRYIPPEEARSILQAGLNSEDSDIRNNAERARESLLKAGRFDFLELDSARGKVSGS